MRDSKVAAALKVITFVGCGVRTEFRIPGRLWKRMVRVAGGDELRVRQQLAIAFMVACSNVANPPVPARRPRPIPVLPPEYAAREPVEADPVEPEGYVVDEATMLEEATMYAFPVPEGELGSQEPERDPWARSWD